MKISLDFLISGLPKKLLFQPLMNEKWYKIIGNADQQIEIK